MKKIILILVILFLICYPNPLFKKNFDGLFDNLYDLCKRTFIYGFVAGVDYYDKYNGILPHSEITNIDIVIEAANGYWKKAVNFKDE